jgi:hypothetical protein
MAGPIRIQLEGIKKLFRGLDSADKEIQQAVVRGMESGRLVVQRGAMKQTPVDTGNLIGSFSAPWDTRGPRDYRIRLTYSAEYALDVHERVGANFRKAGAKAKFLEDPLFDNEGRVRQILLRELRKVTG